MSFGEDPLKLGSSYEEFRELLRGRLERDEYQRAMLKGIQTMVELQRQQVGATENISFVGGSSNVTYEGSAQPLGVGELVVAETADLDEAAADGTVTTTAGEITPLISYDAAAGAALFAVGATDATETQYAIRADGKIIGGWTEAPLGSLGDPFSFVEKLNAVVPADTKLEYVARPTSDVNAGATLVARAFIEDMQG